MIKLVPRQHVSALLSDSFGAEVPGVGSFSVLLVNVDDIRRPVRTVLSANRGIFQTLLGLRLLMEACSFLPPIIELLSLLLLFALFWFWLPVVISLITEDWLPCCP